MKWASKQKGFTIVELLIVVVVIAILAAITVVAFNGIQASARDAARMDKVRAISKAIELYKVDNGRYPPILDMSSVESSCGSQTENWGHCDRLRDLANALAPYMKLDPTSLSAANVGYYIYYYTSQPSDDYQTYGLMVELEGDGGRNDGGYFHKTFEAGPKPAYCMSKYTGTQASWKSYTNVCVGGD